MWSLPHDSSWCGLLGLNLRIRSDQSAVGGPKWTKIDLFRPKWTKINHFDPFWPREYQNPVRNKVILTKMVVLTILDHFGPVHFPINHFGPLWPREYQNPVRNKVILTKMVVLTILDHLGSSTLSDSTAATQPEKPENGTGHFSWDDAGHLWESFQILRRHPGRTQTQTRSIRHEKRTQTQIILGQKFGGAVRVRV